MIKLRTFQDGSLLIPLILFILLFLSAAGFGVWAYTERQDYKSNFDTKKDEAVAVAVKESEKTQEAEFIQREKKPLRTYRGPQSLGSVTLQYPKTWSIYADESQESELKVIGHPKYVPAEGSSSGQKAYALTIEVVNRPYNETATIYKGFIQNGEAKARPYKLPEQPKITGLRVDGNISQEHRGAAVVLPLRDKTLVISTLAEQYVGDFDNIILKNFNFIP